VRLIRPGEGEALCARPGGCGNREVAGLEFCLQHMPDELLDEAEQVSRTRRCRHGEGPVGSCQLIATSGTDPPRCKNHGANLGSVLSKRGSAAVVEGKVQDRLAQIMAEKGERLLNPRQLANPLTELLALAAEMAEWKDIMRGIVIYLLDERRIRSAHNRVGEQLRAEVLLFERAQERYAKILLDIQRAGIEAKLAAIEERQVQVVERALTAALSASGLGLVEQESARKVLVRELRKAG
jgi:hypothetical protein